MFAFVMSKLLQPACIKITASSRAINIDCNLVWNPVFVCPASYFVVLITFSLDINKNYFNFLPVVSFNLKIKIEINEFLINQSIVLLALLQFPKTELQGVHTQLEERKEEN